MRFFIAGIMQGSHLGSAVHTQDYRTVLKEALLKAFSEAEVYDPWHDHQNSLEYSHLQGRDVFLRHNQMCGEVDVVVAFIPEASMGTAIEIWEAYRHQKIVLTISPLKHNWAVKFLSDEIYASDLEFLEQLQTGQVATRLEELLETKASDVL